MNCPYCHQPIPDEAITAEAAKINGKRSSRSDGGGERCPKHGTFMKAGVCKKCLVEEEAA